MEKKMIAIRVTEEQKKKIEERAGDKSITQYLIDTALGEEVASRGFASERSELLVGETAHVLQNLIEMELPLDVLFDKLKAKYGVTSDKKVVQKLLEVPSSSPTPVNHVFQVPQPVIEEKEWRNGEKITIEYTE